MQKISVYVHFPWCARKCPYCDFATKGVDPRTIPQEQYAQSVINEIQTRGNLLKDTRLLSVFFGGGTPSLWAASQVERVLNSIKDAFTTHADDLEITAECNPVSFDDTQADALLEAGINRFSIGVQSLSDDQLKFLGRLHDRKSALRALKAATSRNVRTSGDLIFGMPGHDKEQLKGDILKLIDTGVDHLSAYALTIEKGTPFGQMKKSGRLKVSSDDAYADLYECAEETLLTEGFDHYEVSNYARTDEQSRHNMHYWRGGEYLGVGTAAVGCVNVDHGSARRWKNQIDADNYMRATDIDSLEENEEWLNANDLIREGFMLGLRTQEGTDLMALKQRAGTDPIMGRENAIETHKVRGNLVEQDSYLRVPQNRWLALDGIVCDLF